MKVVIVAVAILLQIALTLNNTRTLVVLDNRNLLQTHKTFFGKLEKAGEVTFAYTFDKDIKLKYYE